MATSDFDELVNDLLTLQRVRGSYAFSKALAVEEELEHKLGRQPRIDEIRAAEGGGHRQAAPAFIREMPGSSTGRRMAKAMTSPARTPPLTAEQRRAAFAQGSQHILRKALSLQVSGQISATEVSQIEAKLHPIAGQVRA